MSTPHPGKGTYSVSAPGRVNLLGEHVDYNQGVVLPVAIDRCVRLQAAPLQDRLLRLRASDLDASVNIPLDQLSLKVDAAGIPLPAWALYPAGVAWAFQQVRLIPGGMEVAYSSDIPIGAGLSSSAAVEVAFAALWQLAGGWSIEPINLAFLCQRSEIEYVGVHCGAMDQISSACGVKDHVLKIDLRSRQVEPIEIPENVAIVIADSSIRRSLSASGYNERRAACEEAVEILKKYLPGIESLRDVRLEDFNRVVGRLPELPLPVRDYARHVIEEMARVKAGIARLKAGDIAAFGELMLACHASLRDLYRVSTRELDELVDIASELPGCWGARLTGAGFGGCTVNLVEVGRIDEFIERLSREYYLRTGISPQIYACRASQGVEAQIIE